MIPTPEKVTILLRSREGAESTVRGIVAAQIEREKLIAARDAAVEKVTALHAPKIDALSSGIERDLELLETWAEEHEEAEFGKLKSITMAGHRFGWRTGNPKVEPRGKLTLKTIIAELVKAGGKLKEQFVRDKPELNKEAILEINRTAEGRTPAVEALSPEVRAEVQAAAKDALRAIGVRVIQTEAFFFEPDREGQPEIRLSGNTRLAA